MRIFLMRGATSALLLMNWLGSQSFANDSPPATPDRFKQTGAFRFTNATGDPYHPYYPPVAVKFPQEFGGIPTVNITFQHIGHCFQHAPWGTMTATNVTTRDFLATVSGCFHDAATWSAEGPTLYLGNVVPTYLVLTVIYAPPGTNGGHSTSSVSYQSGSTAGTTTSSSKTFKSGVTSTVDQSVAIYGTGSGDGLSFESSKSATFSDSIDIRKAVTSTIAQQGPAQDGINHDEDEIWLLLKPSVILGLSSEIAEWKLGNAGAVIQYVHVGWLNGHQPMPPGVEAALAAAGVTPSDYPTILARDPLVDGDGALQSNRFVKLNTTYPYIPPYSANDPVPLSSFIISNTQSETKVSEFEDS